MMSQKDKAVVVDGLVDSCGPTVISFHHKSLPFEHTSVDKSMHYNFAGISNLISAFENVI